MNECYSACSFLPYAFSIITLSRFFNINRQKAPKTLPNLRIKFTILTIPPPTQTVLFYDNRMYRRFTHSEFPRGSAHRSFSLNQICSDLYGTLFDIFFQGKTSGKAFLQSMRRLICLCYSSIHIYILQI